jgi:3-oxoadipate enol-lactonase
MKLIVLTLGSFCNKVNDVNLKEYFMMTPQVALQAGVISRYLVRLGALFSALLMTACASTDQSLGAKSPVASLGEPTMVSTSLGRLAVWDNGVRSSEPTVVLWPSIFSDHVIYSSLVEQWRGKRRLVLIDGPGHGASEGPKDKTFSMQACAVAMKEILDSKSIQNVVVGGTSWGGLVGGEFAILYPQQTRGVILMNTPFFTSPDGASMGEKFITWGSGTLLGTNLFTNGVARSFFLPATREAGGPIMTHFHDSLHRSDAKALSTAIRSVLIERVALADRLPKITAPALVIAGLQDDMYPLQLQREAVKKLPKGQLEVIDTKHISIVDKPTEVARVIDAFLDTAVVDGK